MFTKKWEAEANQRGISVIKINMDMQKKWTDAQNKELESGFKNL